MNKNILVYTRNGDCANYIIKLAETNNVKLFKENKIDGNYYFDHIPNVVNFEHHIQNADEIITDKYLPVNNKKEVIEKLLLIQYNPKYRTNFFNLCGVKNNQLKQFGSKKEFLDYARQDAGFYVYKYLDKTVPAKSMTALVDICETANNFTVADYIKGIRILVYVEENNVFFVFKYRDGFVIKKIPETNSKIIKDVKLIIKFIGEYKGVLKFDTITNTSGTYFINIENGIDKYYSIYKCLDSNKDEIYLSKVFLTNEGWHIIDREKYYNKIFADNSLMVLAGNKYYKNSFFIEETQNEDIDKIDDYNDMFYPRFYKKKYQREIKWLTGQKLL